MKVKGYFYKERGQTFMVADNVKKMIDKAVTHGTPVDTGGKVLYPLFEAPSEFDIRAGNMKKPAWIIRPGCSPTLRWYWQVQEHRRGHTYCKTLGDGLCGFKMVRFYEWNESTSAWELCPMVNHADSQQEKVLDSNH